MGKRPRNGAGNEKTSIIRTGRRYDFSCDLLYDWIVIGFSCDGIVSNGSTMILVSSLILPLFLSERFIDTATYAIAVGIAGCCINIPTVRFNMRTDH